MQSIVRSLGSLALVGGLVAACGAATGATATPTAVAAPTKVEVAVATATPTPETRTATPSTAPAPVEPMAPAFVTGTGMITSTTSGGTTTQQDNITKLTGAAIETTQTMNDPRVTGTATLDISSAESPGGIGFEWGTMKLVNAGGAWDGPFRGGLWANENASDLSGYLVGSGAYEGLTYFFHLRSANTGADIDGVIAPLPAPAP